MPASVSRGWWRELATDLHAEATEIIEDPATTENLQHPGLWALMARSTAELYGWADPRVGVYLDTMKMLRRPTGDYGEHVSWDPFNDGTVNPIDTPYAITTTDYVGMHELAAYDAGVYPLSELNKTIDAVLAWPQTGTVGGLGYPNYSSHANDAGKVPIWNVVASAAAFLLHARTRTDATRAATCLAKGSYWRDKVKAAYSAPLKGWQYSTAYPSNPRQDGPHNAVIADVLQPWITGHASANCAVEQVLAGPLSYGESDLIGGLIRLAYLPSVAPYVDHIVGRVAHEAESLGSAGARAAWAFCAIRTHKAHGGA